MNFRNKANYSSHAIMQNFYTYRTLTSVTLQTLYRLRFKAKKAIEKSEIYSTLKNRDLIL